MAAGTGVEIDGGLGTVGRRPFPQIGYTGRSWTSDSAYEGGRPKICPSCPPFFTQGIRALTM